MAKPRVLLALLVAIGFGAFSAVAIDNEQSLASMPLLSRADLPRDRCTKDIPCSTEACCNGDYCGFSPAHCGKGVCVSQCDAKPECGQYADPPGKECPLNVCCSSAGFCGTTKEFCTGGCQSHCDQPGKTSPSTTNVQDIVIGYVEAWAFLRRGCANREMKHIRADSVTHIYAAFGYIEPGSFDIYPIPGASIETFRQLTDLKQKAPGLRMFLALGGWTFSDNGTDTQPVFGDLSSTSEKRTKFIDALQKFMLEWGFDGVDIDWEYPGAKDRGGSPSDAVNFVYLVRDIRARFKSLERGWGISFTAPSSYWYLRHFAIKDMMEHVDYVNLMTYDIHGSWDNQSDYIGPHIYAHTNLTEIKESLNLLWRNEVPANQVNLGLGFYGRTYTLKDNKCYKPGCGFSGPGNAGTCSGQAGYMSYQDISYFLKSKEVDITHDEEAAVNYFRYHGDQWISFDSVETMKAKVKFANDQGLRGLFIWALTQDTYDSELLDAVLAPKGLGLFKDRNGAGNDGNDWKTIDPDQCHWTDCGKDCSGPYVEITHARCNRKDDGDSKFCCPLSNAPDPSQCHWRAHEIAGFCNSESIGRCDGGEEEVTSSKWYLNSKGGNEKCLISGTAAFCCALERNLVCDWEKKCVTIKDGNAPSDACPSGKKFVTYREGDCSSYKNQWEPFCCNDDSSPSCHWTASTGNYCQHECGDGEVSFGSHELGGGSDCTYKYTQDKMPDWAEVPRRLCCNKGETRVKLKTLPVPLEYLFPNPGGKDDKQEFEIKVDPNAGQSLHPNDHSFGWHIMSGPEDQITTLNKRDGSHWEVYGCDPEMHDGPQTAKLVCTRGGDDQDNNCHTIFKGGVENTVLEMPHDCGPGKYAMAVSLKPAPGQLVPRHLEDNVPSDATIYSLAFDYGFHRLDGRADSKVLLRIDYSDSPNYWQNIVAADPKSGKRRRDIDHIEKIVKRDHGGDWKRYLDHTWREDKRSTPGHELHLLHERWFSEWAHDKVQEIKDWIRKQGDVNLKQDLLEHRVQKTFQYDIVKESRSCTFNGVPTDIDAHIYAVIKADIQTSGVLSLIGNLGDLRTFEQSHLMFRNKGSVDAALVFKARAEMRLPHYENTLFGVAPLGASFKVPGIVTIGPEFKVVGSVDGRVTLDADARVDLNVAEWDYSQTYPYVQDPTNLDDKPDNPSYLMADEDGEQNKFKFGYNIRAAGQLEIHVIPMITFGVVFDPSYSIPSTAADLAIDTYARMEASAESSPKAALKVCYAVKAGYELFARVSAPTIFGVNLSDKWRLAYGDVDAVKQRCYPDDGKRGIHEGYSPVWAGDMF